MLHHLLTLPNFATCTYNRAHMSCCLLQLVPRVATAQRAPTPPTVARTQAATNHGSVATTDVSEEVCLAMPPYTD